MPCNAADLADVKLFELLDQNEITELASVIDDKPAAAGETIFHAGDLGERPLYSQIGRGRAFCS
jgi:hypothetical protein